MDRELKLVVIVLVGFISTLMFIGTVFGIIRSYYQSQITGYTLGQCFWSGDTIRNIVIKETK